MNRLPHNEIVALARQLPILQSMEKQEFIDWLVDSPRIYDAFRNFALEALSKGRTRFSAYMIRERVRWYTNIEYGGQFKISNNVTPYMSRLLALENPVLEKVFARKEVEREEMEPYTQASLFKHTPCHTS